jgi:tetratricopeptide (TPR) repeat protein
MKLKWGQVALLAAGLGSLVAILMLDRKPASSMEEAIEEVQSLDVQSEPLSPVDEAVALVNGSNPMEGVLKLRELAEADPPNVDAVMWLGLFSVQSGQIEKARERFTQVLGLEPGHFEATFQLALLDMEAAAYDRAIAGFEACMESDPSFHSGLFFAARCYDFKGQVAAALSRYHAYLPFAPDTAVSASVQGFIQRLESGESGSKE